LFDAYLVPKLLSHQLLPFRKSGDELVELTSRARVLSALFELVDCPPPLCGLSASSQFSPVRRGVLRVLVLFRFDPVLFYVFVAASLRTVRASVADGPDPVRTVHPVLADSPFFLVRLWWFCWLLRIVRGTWPDCPRHLAGLSLWPVQTVRPSWPDRLPVPGSFTPWFDSSLLSFVLPRVF
jgi:hypothetical protein